MNKIFAILIMCSLSLPVFAADEQIGGQENGVEPNQENVLETISPEEAQELKSEAPFDIESLPAPTQTMTGSFKEPISKKKLAKKFIIAMLCVVGTSVFLYGALGIYNKLRDGFMSRTTSLPQGQQPLETPSDITDAVKTFVEKTRWDG